MVPARHVMALLLLAGPALAQGRGATSIGVSFGGVPIPMIGSIGAGLSGSRALLPHVSIRADAEGYQLYNPGFVTGPCLNPPCASAVEIRSLQFLTAGIQLWELRAPEGVYVTAMAGLARVGTNAATTTHAVWAVGGGILFGLRRPALSLDVRRIQMPRSHGERARWPVTVGLHF